MQVRAQEGNNIYQAPPVKILHIIVCTVLFVYDALSIFSCKRKSTRLSESLGMGGDGSGQRGRTGVRFHHGLSGTVERVIQYEHGSKC